MTTQERLVMLEERLKFADEQRTTLLQIFADHDRRLRVLERQLWAIGGGLAVLQILLKVWH